MSSEATWMLSFERVKSKKLQAHLFDIYEFFNRER
jgi:hypothetical protein